MKNFKKLKVWQKGLDISVALYQVTALLPKTEEFGLKQQMQKPPFQLLQILLKEVADRAIRTIKGFLNMLMLGKEWPKANY